MPTEYTLHGRVSEKTDAFSYGVILLELLTNEKPHDARWAFVEDCEDTVEKAGRGGGTTSWARSTSWRCALGSRSAFRGGERGREEAET